MKEKSQNNNNLSQASGFCSIPSTDLVRGGPTIKYGNSDYDFGKMSDQAYQYYFALKNRNIFVQPVYQDRYTTHYRINFMGSPTKGPCFFNPMAQYSAINVESIQVY